MGRSIGKADTLHGLVFDAVDQAGVVRFVEYRDLDAVHRTHRPRGILDFVDDDADMMKLAQVVYTAHAYPSIVVIAQFRTSPPTTGIQRHERTGPGLDCQLPERRAV